MESYCSRKIPGLDKITISPEIWPGKNLKVQPGDLSKFVPYGNGVYGYQQSTWHPILGDPSQESSGGVVYFGNSVSKEDFKGFLTMMGLKSDWKDYAAFVKDATNPAGERFYRQMRLVSKFGLRFMFNALDDSEYDSFKGQELSVEDALLEFMDSEEKRWGTSFGDPRIDRTFGGDGNFAREELSFGFMMENEYHSIYRIWSRAWLVTK